MICLSAFGSSNNISLFPSEWYDVDYRLHIFGARWCIIESDFFSGVHILFILMYCAIVSIEILQLVWYKVRVSTFSPLREIIDK